MFDICQCHFNAEVLFYWIHLAFVKSLRCLKNGSSLTEELNHHRSPELSVPFMEKKPSGKVQKENGFFSFQSISKAAPDWNPKDIVNEADLWANWEITHMKNNLPVADQNRENSLRPYVSNRSDRNHILRKRRSGLSFCYGRLNQE